MTKITKKIFYEIKDLLFFLTLPVMNCAITYIMLRFKTLNTNQITINVGLKTKIHILKYIEI